MSDEDENIFTELNNNRRHYSALRFAMFTVYFAVIGGLASISFGILSSGPLQQINIALCAKWAGLLVTMVFFWFEILCTLNLNYIKTLAEKLPPRYEEITRRKKLPGLRAHYATWSLYSLIVMFWIYVLKLTQNA